MLLKNLLLMERMQQLSSWQALLNTLLIITCVLSSCSVLITAASIEANTSIYQNNGLRTLLRIYDECNRAEGGFVPCLKKKAITFIDRISNIDAITVSDGIKIIRLPHTELLTTSTLTSSDESALSPAHIQSMTNENELESSLSRSSEDRDLKLTKVLIERLSNYFNGHSLQVSFPKITVEEIGRSLEEGRGKMKKMMGTMMMGMAMKMMGMVPIAIGALFLLAGKALIVSKIALLLAGIIGLKKLLSDGGGASSSSGWSSGGGGGSGGWSAGGGGGGGGGWDRRSFNEAQSLAYRNYQQQHIKQLAKDQQQMQQQQQQQMRLQSLQKKTNEQQLLLQQQKFH